MACPLSLGERNGKRILNANAVRSKSPNLLIDKLFLPLRQNNSFLINKGFNNETLSNIRWW